MAKQLIFNSEAHTKILAGINKLEKATSVTLGPMGRNVIIDEYGFIHSTKDGVSVAKSIVLNDKFENLGASAIREVAEKSNEKVGDGTTTSTLLAAEVYRNGLIHVSLGSNATQIKFGIKRAAEHAVEFIKNIAKPITTKKDIENIAIVSANGDKKVGSMIADVMDRLGNDGTIKVENGRGIDISSEIVEGMVIEKSYSSPYMVTNPETMEAELDNPWVLLVDRKLSNIKELLPTLQNVHNTGRPMLIIAESFADDILATLVMNKMRGGINCVAINAPSYGDNRRAILDDIAILCGGRVVTEATGTRIENAQPASGILGQASRIVVSKNNTIIIGGCCDKTLLQDRISNIKKLIENTTDDFEIEKLRERLAKLTSGVGVITVGATTEAERKELRDRVDDAFYASKSAIRSGIVAGGGSALLAAKRDLVKWISEQTDMVKDELVGAKIFCDSLEAPIRKILGNAGMDSSLIVSRINESDNINFGYNVIKNDYVDMIDDGIIDSAEVVINEIQNSASVASLLLTTEALIVDEVENQTLKN